jgi:hypothetical protein
VLLPPQIEFPPHFRRLRFRLDCGREVSLEGCCILPSALGYLVSETEKWCSSSVVDDASIVQILHDPVQRFHSSPKMGAPNDEGD